jgi:hypothetical protein
MNIRKFAEFIKEEFTDTPESYIEDALKLIQKKIEEIFKDQVDLDENKEKEENSSIAKAKTKGEEKSQRLTFKDLGVQLKDCSISKYSKTTKSLFIKFLDARFSYDLIVLIDLKEGMPKDKAKDFSYKDVENCFIKFKKYNLETLELLGPPLRKNVKIKDIDENFLVELKIELDEMFGDEEEKLEIETK